MHGFTPADLDALTREIVVGCDTFRDLLHKRFHGYRPTLRADLDPRCVTLADAYDAHWASLGSDWRALRDGPYQPARGAA